MSKKPKHPEKGTVARSSGGALSATDFDEVLRLIDAARTRALAAVNTALIDRYLLELLDLPPQHSEGDLQHGLVEKLKQFLIELGRDFCFVGSQYPLQVGGRDFSLDLLFFN